MEQDMINHMNKGKKHSQDDIDLSIGNTTKNT